MKIDVFKADGSQQASDSLICNRQVFYKKACCRTNSILKNFHIIINAMAVRNLYTLLILIYCFNACLVWFNFKVIKFTRDTVDDAKTAQVDTDKKNLFCFIMTKATNLKIRVSQLKKQ